MRPDFAIDPAWLSRIIDASRELAAAHPGRVTVEGHRSGVVFDCTAIRRSLDGGNVYLHEWRESDPRDLHDHPWDCASVILAGGYWEIAPQGRFWRSPGDIVFRQAEEPHRIEIVPAKPMPISLFITGPRGASMDSLPRTAGHRRCAMRASERRHEKQIASRASS
jgi:hypothetical protein